MEYDQVLEKLKTGFGLKDKHILILRALQHGTLTAEQISKKTEIPYGRIYGYLHELHSYQLLEKSAKKPHMYGVKDFSANVVQFMKQHLDSVIKNKSEIMSMMQGPHSEYIEMLDNREKYAYMHLNLMSEGNSMKIVCIHMSFPFSLYPLDWDLFFELRKLITSKRATISFKDYASCYMIYKAYREALKQGKKFTVILEKDCLDYHFNLIKDSWGEKKFHAYIKELQKRLEKEPLAVYITDEYLPMEIDLNEFKVGLALKHGDVTTGILIRSQKAIALYNRSVDDKVKRSVDLRELLPEYLTS